MRGLRVDRRELLVTQLLDAEPDHRIEQPGPTLWPLFAALGTGVTFVVAIFTPWGIVIGAVLTGAALIGWYWPKRPHQDELADQQPRAFVRREARRASAEVDPDKDAVTEAPHRESAHATSTIDASHLATTAFGSRDPLWWGVVIMLVIEGTMFVLLALSYLYLRDQAQTWPPDPIPRLSFELAFGGVALLLSSCVPMAWASRAARRGALLPMQAGLALATLCGVGFLVLRYLELDALSFRWDSHAYGSVFWTLAGLHMMHGIISTAENLVIFGILVRGPVEEKHLVDVTVNALYWYFVVAVGVLTVALLYLDPAAWGG